MCNGPVPRLMEGFCFAAGTWMREGRRLLWRSDGGRISSSEVPYGSQDVLWCFFSDIFDVTVVMVNTDLVNLQKRNHECPLFIVKHSDSRWLFSLPWSQCVTGKTQPPYVSWCLRWSSCTSWKQFWIHLPSPSQSQSRWTFYERLGKVLNTEWGSPSLSLLCLSAKIWMRMRKGFDLRIACTVTSYLEISLNHEEPVCGKYLWK